MTITGRLSYFDHAAAMSGGELALQNLIAALDVQRWSPHVILGETGPLEISLREAGVSVEMLPLPRTLVGIRQDQLRTSSLLNPVRGTLGIRYISRLAQLLSANRADLVHANSLRGCILAGLAGRLAGLPVIWHIHSMVAPPMIAVAGTKLFRWLARWVPDQIVCNSRTTAACFDVPSHRLSVIPNGVDSRRFRPNGQRSAGPMRVGLIGRFAPWKGQHIFIDAVRRLGDRAKDAEFVLAGAALFGEDQYEQLVREQARKSVCEHQIRFLGFVEDVPGLLRDLDIVVHASVQPEPFGQVIIEAMMAGKPVIATSAGGPLDLIEDGVTGRLVPPGDAAALSEAIHGLMADRMSRYRMGVEARRRALERYDIRQTVAAMERVYERVLTA